MNKPRTRGSAKAGAAILSLSFLLGCSGELLIHDPGNDDNQGDGEGNGDDDGLPNPEPTFETDHPRIYLPRNKDRLTASLSAKTPAAVRFRKMVDSQLNGADHYDFKGWYAALIGQLTGDAKYCTYAVTLVDQTVSAEEEKISAGEKPQVQFDSYLYVGPTIGDVMLTYDWCYDALSQGQRDRWLAYAQQSVWNVWNYKKAEWNGKPAQWTGWSTDNPSNNYYYSFLRATMLFGLAGKDEHPKAEEWITFFREQKIGEELVPTFTNDLEGGGSREGTGYGTSMAKLFELYDIWRSSTGEDLAHLTGHTRDSLIYFLHAIVPTRDRIAPIGDHSRDSTAALFDYHRNYLQTLMYLFPNDTATPEAKWTLDNSTVTKMESDFMYCFDFLYDAGEMEPAKPSLGTTFYGPGTGHAFMRSSWDKDATWVQTMAGPYTEVHAHHDQGSFLMYRGEWLAYDQNIQSSSGIHNEIDVHNLVAIVKDGETVPMKLNSQGKMIGFSSGPNYVYAAEDLTDAYSSNADIASVRREMVYLKPDVVVMFDKVDGGSGATLRWQLNTPLSPDHAGNQTHLVGESGRLDLTHVLPESPQTSVLNWANEDDMSGGYRFDINAANSAETFLTVLAVDNAVSEVFRADEAGRIGVVVNYAGGSAHVLFGEQNGDAILKQYDAGGDLIAEYPLTAAIEMPAER